MKKITFILYFICSLACNAQNWNVFNKAYRYNYKYNNSQLISNVLFAEYVSQFALDTLYTMNTIGVVSGNTLYANKPQFLMKQLFKKANGSVELQDTTNITIIPTCTLNQSWLFDSNYNLTATCVAITTETIFNVADSVKTIIVNNVDSIKLSKQFGLVQFPHLYGQNKYYRLVGIENKATYDLNALYGEKVPNAWDFYDFYVGYQWCYESSFHNGQTGMWQMQGCERSTQVVKTKSVTATGYVYNIDKTYIKSTNSYGYCTYSLAPVTFTNTDLSYDGLTSPTLRENKMYPGMVDNQGSAQLVKLGTDNLGRVYKYAGASCSSMGLTMPNQNEPGGYATTSTPNTYTVGGMLYSLSFGVGKGKLTDNLDCLCFYRYCTTCYGTVDIAKRSSNNLPALLYPNPVNTKLNLPLDKGNVKLYDTFGKLVKEEFIEHKNTIDVSLIPNGLYFIEVQNDSFKAIQKLIIQH